MRKLRRTKRKTGRPAAKGLRASTKGAGVPGRAKQRSADGIGAAKDVEKYIERAREPARSRLKHMRAAIRTAVTGEAVEIISYGIPAFKLKRVLVWYAAFSGHCSLFPTAAVIEEFRGKLGAFTVSKGTVQFPLDKPLPTALIKKIVKERVAQSQGLKHTALN
jgi:uncharacterized protein YdhG (YjbR/CyaY superfamily)